MSNAALVDAISALPEQTREEILRYYFLHQPQRVIGACIGRSRSTAWRHIQLELAQERIAEVSRIIKRLYEDNVNGKISDERFMELSADYEAEQAELKKRAAALQAELDKSQAATDNAEKFMGIVRKHLAFEELTPTLLREMVEKIVVHECSYDENGTRRQDIEIYYSFVGKIDLPE